MPPLHWSRSTYAEIESLDRSSAIPILPVGAVEAHGPHLPTSTDRIIAKAMAEAGARCLEEHGYLGVVLPPLDYTAAPFAHGFAGTLSMRPETVTSMLIDIADGLERQGFCCLVIANSHLDPTHLSSLYAAIEPRSKDGLDSDGVDSGSANSDGVDSGFEIIFPDITRKPWALRLGEEFRSGACHAGSYEGSVVLARRPELVRNEIRQGLPANPSSLSVAIRQGHSTFEEAGGPQAYFGDPAAASVAEGESTIQRLGEILAEGVVARLGEGPG